MGGRGRGRYTATQPKGKGVSGGAPRAVAKESTVHVDLLRAFPGRPAKKKLPDDKWTRTQRPTPRFVWRALLQHPNLSVAHDVFTKPQSPRITQDSTVCCDSISWSKAIKKKRISARETGDTVATSERGRQRKQTKETSRHARCPLEAAVAATISKL